MSLKPRNLHPDYAPRYAKFYGAVVFANGTSVTAQSLGAWHANSTGKIVDILFSQPVSGANGTSVTLTVKKNGTTVCTTDALLVPAASANASVGVKYGSLPTNCTRAILKTDGGAELAYGDDLTFDVTTAGSYSSTYPTVTCTVVVDQQKQ